MAIWSAYQLSILFVLCVCVCVSFLSEFSRSSRGFGQGLRYRVEKEQRKKEKGEEASDVTDRPTERDPVFKKTERKVYT